MLNFILLLKNLRIKVFLLKKYNYLDNILFMYCFRLDLFKKNQPDCSLIMTETWNYSHISYIFIIFIRHVGMDPST